MYELTARYLAPSCVLIESFCAPFSKVRLFFFFVNQTSTADVLDAFNTEALKLAAMGVTVVVSSGDNGAAGDSAYCNYPSSKSISAWPVS